VERDLNSPNPRMRIRKIPQTKVGPLTRGLVRWATRAVEERTELRRGRAAQTWIRP